MVRKLTKCTSDSRPLFLRQLPARESLDDAEVIPLATASLFAKLTFSVSRLIATLILVGLNPNGDRL